MFIEFEDYRVKTDERQFITQRKKIIQDSEWTKPENIGKIEWDTMKYYSSLDGALKSLVNHVLLDNDDLQVIQRKLASMHVTIQEIRVSLQEVVK